MLAFQRTFRFADVQLSVRSEGPVSTALSERCHPKLPQGMRIDWCTVATVTLDCVAGARFAVGLTLQPAAEAGWEMDQETGEAFDGTSFCSSNGDVAFVAMRDPDWLANRFALRVVDASQGIAPLTVTYEAAEATSPIIQIAIAETMRPSNEQEALSPCFATDVALDF